MAKKERTIRVIDGKPFIASLPHEYEECCHCGLIHKIKYRILDQNDKVIKDARLEVTCWAMPNLTRAARKKVKIQFGSE